MVNSKYLTQLLATILLGMVLSKSYLKLSNKKVQHKLHLWRTQSMSINLIYAKEKIKSEGKSIFLAGPSPRNNTDKSWRKEAINLFIENGFKGSLLIPEDRVNNQKAFDYIDQIEWEEEALNAADIILFWVPRDLKIFPGFTTNIEWGYWTAKDPSKLLLGSPENTPKMAYLNYYADKLEIPRFIKLKDIIKYASGDKK